MSVIGTTLKEPRVFAHDAVKLCDLPGCNWRGVKGVTILDGGSGFTLGTYDTWLSTPITTSNAGNGLQIELLSTGPQGQFAETDIPLCGIGNAYNVGDIVTVNPTTFIHVSGITNNGTGYPAGGAIVATSGGTGIDLTVTYTDDGLGGVTGVTIVNEGEGYTEGDVITILAGDNNATFTIADSKAATFEITDLTWTEWDYGCPFTSFYTALQNIKIKDVSDPNFGKPLYGQASKCEEGTGYSNPLPNLGDPNINGHVGPIETQDAFMHKVKYTVNCGGEKFGECDYETPGPGAALYIGYPLNALTVIMESGQKATYYNLPSGTFLPISCLTVCDVDAAGEEPPSPGELKQYILALF
jgi:hypothetical protein